MKTSSPEKNKRKTNKTPLVSVLCMTFNQVSFIEETLNGFLIQKTTFPIEILVHDDASTDGTCEIIRNYEKKHPNLIKGIYQTENQYSKKVDIPKQFIFPLINAKYVAICEGDDYWIDPLKLQKQVDFLEQNEDYGLVYTDINRVNEKGEFIDQGFFKNDPTSFCETFNDYLINSPFRAPCTWVFRKCLYLKRNKKYIVGDFPMLLDIVAQSKIYKLEETTANYRILKRSASHFTTIKQEYTYIKGFFEIQLDFAEKYDVPEDTIELIKTNYAFRSYNFAVAENDMNQIKEADRLLKGHPKISFKFKTVQIISKFKLLRFLYAKIFNKRLGN